MDPTDDAGVDELGPVDYRIVEFPPGGQSIDGAFAAEPGPAQSVRFPKLGLKDVTVDGPDAQQTLGTMLAVTGLVHLPKRRYLDTLVPDRLDPFRREIEVASGSLQLGGAAALFVPRLRQTGRWLNGSLQVATLLAAVDNVRHPDRIRRDRVPVPAAGSPSFRCFRSPRPL